MDGREHLGRAIRDERIEVEQDAGRRRTAPRRRRSCRSAPCAAPGRRPRGTAAPAPARLRTIDLGVGAVRQAEELRQADARARRRRPARPRAPSPVEATLGGRRRLRRRAASRGGRSARGRTRATGRRAGPSASRRRGTPRRTRDPDASSPSIWSRRCASSSATSPAMTARARTNSRHAPICSSSSRPCQTAPSAKGAPEPPARSAHTFCSVRLTTSHCCRCSRNAVTPAGLSR